MSNTPENLIDISRNYPFSKEGLEEIKQSYWAKRQWPIVYFIDGKEQKRNATSASQPM